MARVQVGKYEKGRFRTLDPAGACSRTLVASDDRRRSKHRRIARLQITPSALLAFNVGGTLGETLFPWFVGYMFEYKVHLALGVLLCVSQGSGLVSVVVGFTASRRSPGKGKAANSEAVAL